MKKCIGTILLMCCFTNATEISFTVEAPLAQLSLVPKDTFTMVSIGGFEYEQRFGAPMLPIKTRKRGQPSKLETNIFDARFSNSVLVELARLTMQTKSSS